MRRAVNEWWRWMVQARCKNRGGQTNRMAQTPAMFSQASTPPTTHLRPHPPVVEAQGLVRPRAVKAARVEVRAAQRVGCGYARSGRNQAHPTALSPDTTNVAPFPVLCSTRHAKSHTHLRRAPRSRGRRSPCGRRRPDCCDYTEGRGRGLG